MEIRITVADKIRPGEGKKQAQLIDQTGKHWYFWKDRWDDYQIGNSYLIKRHKSSEFRGKTYYTIEESSFIRGDEQDGVSAPISTPVKAVAAPAASDTERRLDIFVCGAFNNMMANPNVSPTTLNAADMIEMIKRFKTAWLTTLSGPPKPGADMDDRLPDGM